MDDYLVPLLLGFSFGNLWLCVLLVFSLQTTNRTTCIGYLVGRALAIVVLSVLAAWFGRMVKVERGVLNLLSGVFLLGFSAFLAAVHILGWVPPWKKKGVHRADDPHGNCSGHCSDCPTYKHPEFSDACSACGDDPRLCTAESQEFEPLTREARAVRGRSVQKEKVGGFVAGMTLGSIRGGTLCSKLTVLIPLLMNASFGKAAGIGLTFTVSSSLYPLLGFLLGSIALKMIKYKRWLFGVSCTMLAAFGIRYFVRGLFFYMM
jgi:hypothetical protein